MKYVNLNLLAVAIMAVSGAAQATVVGTQSDDTYIEVGAATVFGGPHTPGGPGVGVYTMGKANKVDFAGLQGVVPPNADGVTTIHNPIADNHGGMGVFDFAKVAGHEVYFGEWSTAGDVTDGTHTVYYAGEGATASMPTSGTAEYSVAGLSDYASNGLLSGTLTADFGANTLSGGMQNGDTGYSIDIGTATISGNTFVGGGARAELSGVELARDGNVEGHFFGANAAALAGIATFADSQYDAAFGGSRD
ncbi:hypothetical protein CAI21_01935 [Alkalilimnicola ehrlichii]|uniref:Uncharacterized protein n=1 Tax=Alkalilimnicola ehrlichii TaxID=351052 RepID=A0A3E0X3A8_9GAMM|nr:Slam-dependent surface lipoprotein [Alkalilimnicola ehrlichii]RFA31398.1 hypothetical protein CAI21_01935 [Alkalilimnicola ehrlichii]RFA39330.1 hypothetical protein CAL65_00465 [Alkalilimnicola ehrlichii]